MADAFDNLAQHFNTKSKLAADKISHFENTFAINESRDVTSAFGHMRAKEKAFACLLEALELVKKAMSTSSMNHACPVVTHRLHW